MHFNVRFLDNVFSFSLLPLVPIGVSCVWHLSLPVWYSFVAYSRTLLSIFLIGYLLLRLSWFQVNKWKWSFNRMSVRMSGSLLLLRYSTSPWSVRPLFLFSTPLCSFCLRPLTRSLQHLDTCSPLYSLDDVPLDSVHIPSSTSATYVFVSAPFVCLTSRPRLHHLCWIRG